VQEEAIYIKGLTCDSKTSSKYW